MRPVAPRLGLPEVTLAEEQPEYAPITVAGFLDEDGRPGVISRWRLTDEERAQVAAGADLYLSLFTFGQPMQPVHLEVGRPGWAPPEEH